MKPHGSKATWIGGRIKTTGWGAPAGIALMTFLLTVSHAHAASVTLRWNRNPEAFVTGYHLFYGHETRNYSHCIDAGNVDRITVTDLEPNAEYYFAVTAYTQEQAESGFSNEVYYRTRSSKNGRTARSRRPRAVPAVLTTYQDTPLTSVLQATDPDNAPLEFTVVKQGARGYAVILDSASGAFTYMPAAGVTGRDTFKFRVSNGQASSNAAAVKMRILPPPTSSTRFLLESTRAPRGEGGTPQTQKSLVEGAGIGTIFPMSGGIQTRSGGSSSPTPGETMVEGAISLDELKPDSFLKVDRYVAEALARDVEGALTWRWLLDSGQLDFLSVRGFDVLLPVEKEAPGRLKVVQCTLSDDREVLTLLLEDTTVPSSLTRGRLAVCDRVPGEEWYLATLYREWKLSGHRE